MWIFTALISSWLILPGLVDGLTCETIAIPECQKLYNLTGHATREENTDSITDWKTFYLPLVFDMCTTPYTAMTFTCLLLFPQCEENQLVPNRKPCRDFCRQIRTAECEKTFEMFSQLPRLRLFDCSIYNESDCISVRSDGAKELIAKIMPQDEPDDPNVDITPVSDNCTARKLREGYFSEADRTFATAWIAVWSALCFISTVITVITFCLDRSRFQYPWRPIIYLSVSFAILSVSYFLALALGSKLIIRPLSEDIVATKEEWQWAHAPCIIIFTLLYYTQFASAMWWIVLTLCWFLAAGLKWGNEAIAQLAPFYHVLAWSIPLILTISLMAAKVIGGDDLTGTCFVVRDHNGESFYGLLLGFILPMVLIVVVGGAFMIIGFLGIIRVRSHFRKGGEETGSLDKLIIRMGVFNIIYLIPAVIIISCSIYELVDQVNWCPAESEQTYCGDCHRASTATFITRILFSLVVGILSGVWIWSKKTLMSWKTAFAKCFSPRSGDSADLNGEPTTTSLTDEPRVSMAKLDRKESLDLEMNGAGFH